MLKKFPIILITYFLYNQAALAAIIVGSIPNSLSKQQAYLKGSSLDGKNIRLKTGQSLKLALSNGKIRTITGPYNGKLKSVESSSFGQRWLSTIKRLFATNRVGHNLRGDEDLLWTIDLSTAVTINWPLYQDTLSSPSSLPLEYDTPYTATMDEQIVIFFNNTYNRRTTQNSRNNKSYIITLRKIIKPS